MNNPADSFLLGGGGASAKFENVGDTVTGTIVTTEVTNQTDLATGAVLTWDDGSPRQQLVVSLQTQEKTDADDDGVRKVGLKVDRLGTVLAKPRWLQRLLPRTQ